MRELTEHRVNECNEGLRILVSDAPGAGGACHHYRIVAAEISEVEGRRTRLPCEVHFQNGPIKEVGVNGVTHEALLAIIADRLSAFQAGPYACPENGEALAYVELAQTALHRRTRKRLERGVEGTMAT